MKILKFVLALVLIILLAVSCQRVMERNSRSDSRRAQETLLGMESYAAAATLEIVSNRGRTQYEIRQFYKMSGEYRIEFLAPGAVSGNVIVNDNRMVSQYNPRIEGRITLDVPETRDRLESLLGSFVKNFLNSEETSVEITTLDSTEVTVLEVQIPGEHPYMAVQRVWLNNETHKPIRMIVFDPDGIERIIVTYQEFEYNVVLEDEVFRLEAVPIAQNAELAR